MGKAALALMGGGVLVALLLSGCAVSPTPGSSSTPMVTVKATPAAADEPTDTPGPTAIADVNSIAPAAADTAAAPGPRIGVNAAGCSVFAVSASATQDDVTCDVAAVVATVCHQSVAALGTPQVQTAADQSETWLFATARGEYVLASSNGPRLEGVATCITTQVAVPADVFSGIEGVKTDQSAASWASFQATWAPSTDPRRMDAAGDARAFVEAATAVQQQGAPASRDFGSDLANAQWGSVFPGTFTLTGCSPAPATTVAASAQTCSFINRGPADNITRDGTGDKVSLLVLEQPDSSWSVQQVTYTPVR